MLHLEESRRERCIGRIGRPGTKATKEGSGEVCYGEAARPQHPERTHDRGLRMEIPSCDNMACLWTVLEAACFLSSAFLRYEAAMGNWASRNCSRKMASQPARTSAAEMRLRHSFLRSTHSTSPHPS